jgi:dephospho-CoA kinase
MGEIELVIHYQHDGGKMANWPGKFVIGLTGNIATGKSVVRKMLEHLDAYGIDADALSHRAITKGAPGYDPVVETFGKWILGPDGEIDRAKLGRLVFTNPEALSSLEDIVHPLVRQAIDLLVRRTRHKVIAIEAIKLLESGLRNYCDSIWVTNATEGTQVKRLMAKRKMSRVDALERIHAQSAQDIKIKAANVIINNNQSFEDTWKQVTSAWQVTLTGVMEEVIPAPVEVPPAGQLSTRRAGPKEAQVIADFINQISKGKRQMTRSDIMAAFGEKAFLFLNSGDQIAGLLGWQVENLVARVDDIYIDPGIPLVDAMRVMTTEVEKASRELQCEAALLFLPPVLAKHKEIWKDLDYSARTVEELSVRAWQEAAIESMPDGTEMMFKQLRVDRVLRPM